MCYKEEKNSLQGVFLSKNKYFFHWVLKTLFQKTEEIARDDFGGSYFSGWQEALKPG